VGYSLLTSATPIGLPPPVIAPLAETSANVLPVGLLTSNTGVVLTSPSIWGVLPPSLCSTIQPFLFSIGESRAPFTETMPIVGDIDCPALHASIMLDCPTADLEVQRVMPMRRDERQVLDSVVGLDVVDVVNVQPGRYRTMMRFPHVTVFIHPHHTITALDHDSDVPGDRVDLPPPGPFRMIRPLRMRDTCPLIPLEDRRARRAALRVVQRSVSHPATRNGIAAIAARFRPQQFRHIKSIPRAESLLHG